MGSCLYYETGWTAINLTEVSNQIFQEQFIIPYYRGLAYYIGYNIIAYYFTVIDLLLIKYHLQIFCFSDQIKRIRELATKMIRLLHNKP